MKNLRNIRIKEHLNQEEMASYMRVSYSAYKKVENGNRKPSAEFIRKFKTAFPYVSADIFFEEGDNTYAKNENNSSNN